MKTAAVAVLGDINWDLVLVAPRLPSPGRETLVSAAVLRLGGSAANTARWLARLGMETRLFAALGDDPLGQLARAELAQEGLSPEFLRLYPGASGICCALVDNEGERTLLTHRGANALLSPPLPEGWLLGVGWLHVSGYALLERGSRAAVWEALAQARGVPVSVDPGMVSVHGHGEFLRDLGPVDVFLPNHMEAWALTGEERPARALPLLLGFGKRVFLKLGAEGCLAADESTIRSVPAISARITDPVGAGDAFNAGVIAASLLGGGLLAQAGLGNVLGALAATGSPLTAQNLRQLARALPEEVQTELHGVLARLGV